jgi:uncharacterized membrane protein YkvA (DUF1232 family)
MTENLPRDLWRKLRSVAAHIPFAEDAVAIYYCSLDRATPLRVRAAIMGALAYFVLPADAVPDFLPALGFTDDAAIFAATLQLVSAYILPEHREAARRALGDLGAAKPQ